MVAPRFKSARMSGFGAEVVLKTTSVPAGRADAVPGMRCQACVLMFHVQMSGWVEGVSCVLMSDSATPPCCTAKKFHLRPM